ncbi:MAG: hypothetical protein AB4290_03915 [Spirulina sp.]
MASTRHDYLQILVIDLRSRSPIIPQPRPSLPRFSKNHAFLEQQGSDRLGEAIANKKLSLIL